MSLLIFVSIVFLLVLVAGGIPFALKQALKPVVLHRMTAIAAGFLIAAALLVALPEGFELFLHSETDHGALAMLKNIGLSEAGVAGLFVLIGFLFLLMLEGFGFGHDLHEEHHDHAEDHGHDHLNHPAGSAKNVVIGLSLHSIADGLALGAAFSLGEFVLSMQLAIVILMHKFPAAFSLSVYSLHERHHRGRSMLDLLLFAISTPIAMLVAASFFNGISEGLVGVILLFSAGGFIYVATVDVLPDIHIQEKSRQTLWLVLAGILSMIVLSILLSSLGPDLHIH